MAEGIETLGLLLQEPKNSHRKCLIVALARLIVFVNQSEFILKIRRA
jgi:hypothetical protein